MSTDESGAGTILAAGLALAVLLLMALVLGLGQAAAAAARAATAADLAALAAADAYRGLSQGAPCQLAVEVSQRNGATLQECTLAGDRSVQVRVSVGTALPWPAHGSARAGPPPDTVHPVSVTASLIAVSSDYLACPTALPTAFPTAFRRCQDLLPDCQRGALLSRTFNNRTAPGLSRGLFLLPHLGDCTHEGHPVGHSQA